MSTASVTISGSSSGAPGPSIIVGPITITSSAPVGDVNVLTLQSGENAITIPAGTTLVIVQLPAGNAVATTFEGVSGATASGVSILAAGGVIAFQPAAGQTSFYLHAASAHSAPTDITFI